MSDRVIFVSKYESETKEISFDFLSDLGVTETILDVSVTPTVYSGTDAAPSGLLDGLAWVTGSVVTQSITSGVAGVQYTLACGVTTSSGQLLVITAYLAVLASTITAPGTPGTPPSGPVALTVEIRDDSIVQGDTAILDFTGDGVAATVAGATGTINIPGLHVKDEGVEKGITTTIDFVGTGVVATVSGGVATVTIARAAGGVVQVARTEYKTIVNGTTSMPYDNSIPQVGEGTQFMSRTITPTSAANNLRIQARALMASGASNTVISGGLFKDGAANAIAASSILPGTDSGSVLTMGSLIFDVIIAAGSVALQTFTIRAGNSDGTTIGMNGSTGGAQIFGGVANSFIQVEELQA